GVGAPEDRAGSLVQVADLVAVVALAAEVGEVALVDQGEDAPAHRHARLPRVTGPAPRLAEHADLLRLLHVQRLAGLVELQGRALQVHAEARRPGRRGVRRRAPPDAPPEALRVRLEPQQAGRVREHRPRVRLGEALA